MRFRRLLVLLTNLPKGKIRDRLLDEISALDMIAEVILKQTTQRGMGR